MNDSSKLFGQSRVNDPTGQDPRPLNIVFHAAQPRTVSQARQGDRATAEDKAVGLPQRCGEDKQPLSSSAGFRIRFRPHEQRDLNTEEVWSTFICGTS